MDTEIVRLLSQLRTLHTMQTANLIDHIKALNILEDAFGIYHPMAIDIPNHRPDVSEN